MKTLNVYLSFNGDCEEALNFYVECLDGNIVSINRYKGSPVEVSDEHKNKILHAEFRAGDIYFMAADDLQSGTIHSGNNTYLSINFNEGQDQKNTFNKLSEGGQVIMPLEDKFWGAKFGMCKDKFGINWMFTHQKKQH